MRELVLIESGRRRSRPAPGAGIVSIGLHGGLALLAVIATARPPWRSGDSTSETRVHFAAPARTPSAPSRAVPDPSRPRSVAAAVLPSVPQHLTVSPQIPDLLPPIGVSLFDPSAITELGEHLAVSPTGSGDPGLASPAAGGAYSPDQVEEPAAFLAGQAGPRYPEPLLHERIAGRVRVRFVVGVTGRAEGAPEIVFATRSEFASSVRAFLARARYRAARIGGKPVPQLVEQEFVFELKR